MERNQEADDHIEDLDATEETAESVTGGGILQGDGGIEGD